LPEPRGARRHGGAARRPLSGGQSQRVAIARALMQHPEIVLADEPAASLDPQAGDEVMQLFASLMREEAKTVVFTSHNLTMHCPSPTA
jgi:phosphonate transport system ATP-binding protein